MILSKSGGMVGQTVTNWSRGASTLRRRRFDFWARVWHVLVPIVDAPCGKDTNFVRNSMLYREFLAEREEILRHKWLESEKAGYDIGFERALLDWVVKYRGTWRENRPRRLRAAHGSA